MSDRVHLSPPDVGPAEEAALVRAIRSGWVAPLGPEVDAFEAELAAATGRTHAVALSSGTAALHLGLLNLGVGPGDVVVTATMTFAATANAIAYTGAQPVFVDCEASGGMSPELLAQAVDDQLDRGAHRRCGAAGGPAGQGGRLRRAGEGGRRPRAAGPLRCRGVPRRPA